MNLTFSMLCEELWQYEEGPWATELKEEHHGVLCADNSSNHLPEIAFRCEHESLLLYSSFLLASGKGCNSDIAISGLSCTSEMRWWLEETFVIQPEQLKDSESYKSVLEEPEKPVSAKIIYYGFSEMSRTLNVRNCRHFWREGYQVDQM
ncbi:hypothetical protein BaRGS_00007096 [Batillaria attramentaria]|uniref:Uncharacterized protein n=1 Tax=Batillaria attramentaria TaxID=370345 RepID=A0ABD0LQ41_9CAEN